MSSYTPDNVLESLENESLKVFEWFSNNQRKANHDNWHLLISVATSSTIRVKDNEIFISDSEKVPVVAIINNKLKFSNT